MNASKLIDVTTQWHSGFFLKSDRLDNAVIVERSKEKVFYFSIPPNLPDKEIEKQFTDFLSAKRIVSPETINGKPIQ